MRHPIIGLGHLLLLVHAVHHFRALAPEQLQVHVPSHEHLEVPSERHQCPPCNTPATQETSMQIIFLSCTGFPYVVSLSSVGSHSYWVKAATGKYWHTSRDRTRLPHQNQHQQQHHHQQQHQSQQERQSLALDLLAALLAVVCKAFVGPESLSKTLSQHPNSSTPQWTLSNKHGPTKHATRNWSPLWPCRGWLWRYGRILVITLTGPNKTNVLLESTYSNSRPWPESHQEPCFSWHQAQSRDPNKSKGRDPNKCQTLSKHVKTKCAAEVLVLDPVAWPHQLLATNKSHTHTAASNTSTHTQCNFIVKNCQRKRSFAEAARPGRLSGRCFGGMTFWAFS